MRYLLVGNAVDDVPQSCLRGFDMLVEVNRMRFWPGFDFGSRRLVFVCNTGEVTAKIVGDLLDCASRSVGSLPKLIEARHPKFYRVKERMLKCFALPIRDYYHCNDVKLLRRTYEVSTVSFISCLRLETYLLRRGMLVEQMPSTGHVALHWITNRLRASDCIQVVGFTYEGWAGHPYALERKISEHIVKRWGCARLASQELRR